ncbi:unnamed protein product [Strongylus vulgaris]|uniref:Uncharacterized protein n=1 Tax=Strongylus vulgaris TaxID=40348 RepID=A0A3P7LG24_STRVU|nr:unnamed protein product [Strongylus vulgaris]
MKLSLLGCSHYWSCQSVHAPSLHLGFSFGFGSFISRLLIDSYFSNPSTPAPAPKAKETPAPPTPAPAPAPPPAPAATSDDNYENLNGPDDLESLKTQLPPDAPIDDTNKGEPLVTKDAPEGDQKKTEPVRQ